MTPDDPIEFGRRVTYSVEDGPWNGPSGKGGLRTGIVRRCKWYGHWQVDFMDGQSIGLDAIVAVAELDSDGQVIASWTTQELWREDECAR